jgi:hypothetical protein
MSSMFEMIKFRAFVAGFIALVCVCGSAEILIDSSSENGEFNNYDSIAKKIAIATIVLFTVIFVYLCWGINTINKEEEEISWCKVIIYCTMFTCGAYIIFSPIYAYHSSNTSMTTSSERYYKNRRVALTITITALINWCSINILIISELIAYIIRKYREMKKSPDTKSDAGPNEDADNQVLERVLVQVQVQEQGLESGV